MSEDDRRLARRLAKIGGAAALMVAAVLALGALATGDADDHGEHARSPGAVPPASALAEGPGSAGAAAYAPPAGSRLASEGEVFRLSPGATTLAMDAERRAGAKVRDLASYRRLRAYPGAPPAIPHDVDDAWLRTQACNTCHARGGWVPDQGAYAPVTPHPQFQNCMQCHVDGAEGGLFVTTEFEPADWPALEQQALTWGDGVEDRSPPPIPHALQLRGNCLACHAGPAAVAEVRTTHPERASCRQCHAAMDDVGTARGASAVPPEDLAFTRGVK